MLMTEIRRGPAPLPLVFCEPVENLAEKAMDVLGYEGLAAAVTAPIKDRPLASALQSLDIDILNEMDVERYMVERQIEVAREKFEEWLTAKHNPLGWDPWWAPQWQAVEIGKYRKAVPEFVLHKAIQVREALPDFEIVVYELELHPDPFLAVRLGKWDVWSKQGEQYLIEVWDEPRFEGRI